MAQSSLARPPEPSIFAPAELLQRPNTLLEPLLFRYPKVVSVLHDIGEDGTTEEDHMFSAWRVFNADFEFLTCTADAVGKV